MAGCSFPTTSLAEESWPVGEQLSEIVYSACMATPDPSKKDAAKTGASSPLETVEPIGKRVLLRKDDDKKQTKTGIHLPDKIEIPTLTGRVVAISKQVERDEDYPIRRYDRVLFNPKHGIPVDFEGDNRLFVIPIEDIVAVFRRDAAPSE